MLYKYIYIYATAIYMLHDKEMKHKIDYISLISSQMYFHKMLFPFFLSQKFFQDLFPELFRQVFLHEYFPDLLRTLCFFHDYFPGFLRQQ